MIITEGNLMSNLFQLCIVYVVEIELMWEINWQDNFETVAKSVTGREIF